MCGESRGDISRTVVNRSLARVRVISPQYSGKSASIMTDDRGCIHTETPISQRHRNMNIISDVVHSVIVSPMGIGNRMISRVNSTNFGSFKAGHLPFETGGIVYAVLGSSTDRFIHPASGEYVTGVQLVAPCL